MKGFLCSIDIYSDNVLMQVDFTSKIVKTFSILDQLYDLWQSNSSEQQIKKELVGSSVIAYYGNFRVYRISDINFKLSILSKFESNGKSITYKQYYQNQYNIELKDEKQPLLIFESKRLNQKIFLVPELCY